VSSRPACAVIVARDRPLVSELIESIGADVLRIDPNLLDAPSSPQEWSGEGIVWIHIVPAGESEQSELGEAGLLLRSADVARRVAADADRSLTFVALVPSRGLFTGAIGLSCDLAAGALEGLIRSQIGAWSADGARLLGVVYAGLQGQSIDGERPPEEIRRRTPIGALGTVDQLADAIRFLGSGRAAYVTGTLVHVDGGWNAYSWIYPARTI
jgi:hypothetical protein